LAKRTAIRLLVLAAVLGWAALLLGYTLQPYVLPTGSMEPTIHAGDRLLVVKHFLVGRVERGDLVTMIYPPDPKQTFIKRVVGVPGDRIRIVNKQLYLNGKPAAEPYVRHDTDYVDSYRDNFPSASTVRILEGAQRMLDHDVQSGEVVVPAGNYFVLGDNRDESLDSRYWGFVPAANVIGRPVYIYSGHAGPLHRIALQ
jgi:signal peptidase I